MKNPRLKKTISRSNRNVIKKPPRALHHVKTYSLRDVLADITEKENSCFVVMDELTDVHNVGAILRTAAASNVDGIIISKHTQAPINETVVKTSANTAHLVPVVEMNINEAIRVLKEHGYWVHGLFMNGEENLWQSDLKGKTVIVIGSEGFGIHAATKKLCDFALQIPMNENVESLNASVATAIVLYERLRQVSK